MIETRYIEALLFAAAKPLDLDTLVDIFSCSVEDVLTAMGQYEKELQEDRRGLVLRTIGDTFTLVTNPDCSTYVEKIREREERLSSAALETLAIIAFKQPITRAEIEEIRGVNCERMLKLLLERELICDRGRKAVVGRPLLYGTTDTFLRSVGISQIDELKND